MDLKLDKQIFHFQTKKNAGTKHSKLVIRNQTLRQAIRILFTQRSALELTKTVVTFYETPLSKIPISFASEFAFSIADEEEGVRELEWYLDGL